MVLRHECTESMKIAILYYNWTLYNKNSLLEFCSVQTRQAIVLQTYVWKEKKGKATFKTQIKMI